MVVEAKFEQEEEAAVAVAAVVVVVQVALAVGVVVGAVAVAVVINIWGIDQWHIGAAVPHRWRTAVSSACLGSYAERARWTIR